MVHNQDIQLLPETRKRIDIKTPGGNKVLLSAIAFLILMLGVGFYFSLRAGNLEKKVNSLNLDLANLESKRDEVFENNILITKQQLGLVSGYIDNHLYWTIMLIKLENLLQDKVQLTRLDFQKLDDYNEVSMGGKTINYSTLAKQMAAFLSDSAIQDIELQGAETKSSGLVDFNMKLKIKSSSLHNEQ